MPPFRSSSILLVEDDIADVRLTVELLRSAKFVNRISVIHDGAEAIGVLRDAAADAPDTLPDMVLLDLGLPGVSGREVLAEMRAIPGLTQLPVYVLSGHPVEEEAVGANGYLAKPLDVDLFVELVTRDDRFWIELVSRS